MLDSCPACAEVGRVAAAFKAGLPKDPVAAEVAMAGVYVKVVPFDPTRDLPVVVAGEAMEASPQEPSLADPIKHGDKLLYPPD